MLRAAEKEQKGWRRQERTAKTETPEKQREGSARRQSHPTCADPEEKDREVPTKSIHVEVISTLAVLVDWGRRDEMGVF